MQAKVSKQSRTPQFPPVIAYLANGGTLGSLNKVSGKTLDAVYSMAWNQYQAKKYSEAARAFQYLCFHDHRNADYFLGLGACQQMMRVYRQAVQTYYYAARLDYSDPLPLLYIGDCFLALRQRDKAYRSYRSALASAHENQFQGQELERIKKLLPGLETCTEDNHG